MNVHQKPRAGILLEVDLSVRPESYYYYYYYYYYSMTVRGRRTQPLLMMAIQITHKQERGTDILSLHGSH